MSEPLPKPNFDDFFQDLIGKVPEELRPLAVEFGPFLHRFAADQAAAWAWLLLAQKDWSAAYSQALSGMANTEQATELQKRIAALADLNIEQAAQKKIFEQIGQGITMALIRLVLLWLGVF